MNSRKRGPCAHTTCIVLREEGGHTFYGRCLVCGKIGSDKSSSKSAYEALVADLEQDPRVEDDDPRYGDPLGGMANADLHRWTRAGDGPGFTRSEKELTIGGATR